MVPLWRSELARIHTRCCSALYSSSNYLVTLSQPPPFPGSPPLTSPSSLTPWKAPHPQVVFVLPSGSLCPTQSVFYSAGGVGPGFSLLPRCARPLCLYHAQHGNHFIGFSTFASFVQKEQPWLKSGACLGERRGEAVTDQHPCPAYQRSSSPEHITGEGRWYPGATRKLIASVMHALVSDLLRQPNRHTVQDPVTHATKFHYIAIWERLCYNPKSLLSWWCCFWYKNGKDYHIIIHCLKLCLLISEMDCVL